MAELGIRPKVLFPRKYKDFYLVRQHGRVYGLPSFLGPSAVEEFWRYTDHPQVLSASTREALEVLIDQQGGADLNLAAERRHSGLIHGVSEKGSDPLPVEFAGWLPVFRWSRDCGGHPQFEHRAQPPEGYRFTCSAPSGWRVAGGAWSATGAPRSTRRSRAIRWLFRFIALVILAPWALVRSLAGVCHGSAGFAPRARLRVLAALIRLFCTLLLKGARPDALVRFLRSRHFESQVLMAQRWQGRPGLAFLPSMPFTYGQDPWMIEIEDLTTLFCPFLDNGNTGHLQIKKSPYFRIVKTLLESARCRAIVTHMRSTAALVRTLFGSARIADKVHCVPLGVRLPARHQSHMDEGDDQPLDLLFINSWHQHPTNFYVRGGLDVLEAFGILHRRYPRLRLTLRTSLPGLDSHYHRLIESGWVRVIGRFLSAAEMEELHARSHIFLLPAARVHIVSLLQAMSCGLAVVTSDGWGIKEYITHGRNGLVVPGRYGKVSWADEKAGMLREDYDPMYTPDAKVVRGIVEAVSRLVEDRMLRRRLGGNARADVAAKWSVEQWNRGLKRVFDQVTGNKASTADRQRQACGQADDNASTTAVSRNDERWGPA